MKQKFKNELRDLTQMVTVSGSEQEAIKYLKPRLEKCSDSVELTGTGNLIARKKGNGDGPKVIITAHMDEIGFAVKNITAEGFIKFEKVGDFSDKMIPARKVWIQTKEDKIPGVIGMRAGHLLTPEENLRPQTTMQSYIDVGATSKEEVESLGVYIGSKICLQSDFMEMSNPDIISTKCIDDKINCVIALNIMENLDKKDFNGELIAVFSTLEETTIAGMVPAYNYIDPDYAIVLDTVPCGDVPDIVTEDELPVYLGKGPVMIVSQGDPTVVRYCSINPKIRELLYLASDDTGIKMQELAISEKAYITEESLAFMSGSKGVPAATVAVPRRYSHAPIELLNINDAVKTYELLMGLMKRSDSVEMTFI